jgi:hypothetical protein
MGPEFYRVRAAEAMRKAHADLFNSHIYREIACCYEGSPPTAMSCRTLISPHAALQDRVAPGTNSNVTSDEVMSGCASEPVAAHLLQSNPTVR